MFIQTEATPNPATLKFLPGKSVLEGKTRDFTSAEDALHSPLARRIFGVSGVERVFFGADFITVTSAEAIEKKGNEAPIWNMLKPAILGAIMEHYMSGEPILEEYTDSDTEHGGG